LPDLYEESLVTYQGFFNLLYNCFEKIKL
jgi:hypothetical protein